MTPRFLLIAAIFLVLVCFYIPLVRSSNCKVYKGGVLVIPPFGQVHGFACCDNRGDADKSCVGKTYHGGSNKKYCKNDGTSNWPGSTFISNFCCPNCKAQGLCSLLCDLRGWDFPGLCWNWMACFVGCCTAANGANWLLNKLNETEVGSGSGFASGEYGSAFLEFEFCGDGTCSSSESSTSCPADCCTQASTTCQPGSNTCPCCIASGSGSGSGSGA